MSSIKNSIESSSIESREFINWFIFPCVQINSLADYDNKMNASDPDISHRV